MDLERPAYCMFWPERLPVITPLDFSLWVYVKDKAFLAPVDDLQTLNSKDYRSNHIYHAGNTSKHLCEIEYRLDIF